MEIFGQIIMKPLNEMSLLEIKWLLSTLLQILLK